MAKNKKTEEPTEVAVQFQQPQDNQTAMPTINFNGGDIPGSMLTPSNQPMEAPGKRAGDLVERAFEQAVVNQVVNNQDVQSDLLKSAEQVIHSKTSAIKSQAALEDKAVHFNNKKGACECFGYNETTTEKWAVNYMNVWHNIMTAIWVTIGMVTFAPITFIAKKIKVIFKVAWVAILLAVIIYFIVILSPIWGKLLANWISSLQQVAEETAGAAEIIEESEPVAEAIRALFPF